MWTLQEELSPIEIGNPSHHHNLTVLPLFRHESTINHSDYLLLDDALEKGLARVTEFDQGGSVPELAFVNSADLPVLLLDGEELIGAKQNRVLNLTILVPPKVAITIPVSCVEAGRWHMSPSSLKTSDHLMYAQIRAERAGHVTQSIRTSGSRASNQTEVWRSISQKASRLRSPSPTEANCAYVLLRAN